MVAYFDTSILVNVYVPQSTGTPNALRLVRQHSPVIITPFGTTELKNAIHRLGFQGAISDEQLANTLQSIDDDLQTELYEIPHITWIDVFQEADKIAMQVTKHYGIRTLDLLHLALVSPCSTDFFTADLRQHVAAQVLGLNSHIY